MQRRARASMAIQHLSWIVLAGAAVLAQAAQGQFPARPVRLIVPNVPSGANDIMARTLQMKLGELWGQPVIVDNRAGASPGGIAFALAANAPPDGHTLLVSSVSITIVETTLAKTLGSKPSRELPKRSSPAKRVITPACCH